MRVSSVGYRAIRFGGFWSDLFGGGKKPTPQQGTQKPQPASGKQGVKQDQASIPTTSAPSEKKVDLGWEGNKAG